MATAKITRSNVEITLTLNQEEADWLRHLVGDYVPSNPVNHELFCALKPLTTFKPLS